MFVMANFKKKENVKKDQFIPHRNQLWWCYARSLFLSLLFSTPHIQSNLFLKMERVLKKEWGEVSRIIESLEQFLFKKPVKYTGTYINWNQISWEQIGTWLVPWEMVCVRLFLLLGLRAQNKAICRFLPKQKGYHFTYHTEAQFWHRVLWMPEVLQQFEKQIG